jgi:hypothetical protein
MKWKQLKKLKLKVSMIDEKITSRVVIEILKLKFPSPEYGVFEEIAMEDGATSRRFDVIVTRLWGGNNPLLGFEVKVSKQDFYKELDRREKRELIEKSVHQTFFIAPKGIIKEDEVPENWGFMEVSGGKIFTKKHAMFRENPKYQLKLTRELLEQTIKEKFTPRPLEIPREIFKVAGQDLTPAEFMAKAKELTGAWYESEIKRLEDKLKSLDEQGAKYKDLERFKDEVKDALGYSWRDDPTTKEVIEKVNSKIIPKDVLRHIEGLNKEIQKALSGS